jgi:hypothetical protein
MALSLMLVPGTHHAPLSRAVRISPCAQRHSPARLRARAPPGPRHPCRPAPHQAAGNPAGAPPRAPSKQHAPVLLRARPALQPATCQLAVIRRPLQRPCAPTNPPKAPHPDGPADGPRHAQVLLQRIRRGRDELQLRKAQESGRLQSRLRNAALELDTLHRQEMTHLEQSLAGASPAGKFVPLRDASFRRKREMLFAQLGLQGSALG